MMTRASGGDQKSSAGRSTTWTNKFRTWSQNEVKSDNIKRDNIGKYTKEQSNETTTLTYAHTK